MAGLPLGIVITSAESADVIHKGMITLKELFPECLSCTSYVDKEYEVDTQKWICTVRRTGYPSGEQCKHQHAVANKLNVTALNLLPYFKADGHHLHASIAVGPHKVGDKSFYAAFLIS